MNVYNVSFPGLGLEDLQISRIAFNLFGIEVYWYGLLIAFSVLLSLFLAYKSASNFDINPDHVVDTIIAIVPFMLIFARMYYVVFALDEFRGDWFKIFNMRTGGLAFYGGVIGGIIAIWAVTKFRKIKFSKMTDLLVVYVPLAQGIGRWGNFFNQEAFGTNTSLPWGMISEGTTYYLRSNGIGDPSLPVHPTFMYEFIANMIIFVILIFIRSKSKRPFETTVWYFVLYGLVRFFVEAIRTDPLYIGNTSLRISMVLSGLMFIGGIGVLLIIRKINLDKTKKIEE